MDLDLEPFAVDLADPLHTAAGSIEERSGYLVRVESADVAGLGEATPLPGWTEPLEVCRAALADAVDVLADRGPDAALRSLEGTPAARHGLSLALADRRARRLDVPLYRELAGGAGRVERVPANATIGDGAVAETASAARAAVDAGFECVKCKVGVRSPDADRERIEAVRATVGSDVAVRADANGAWDRETAAAAAEWLGAADVTYVEQPLPADDLAGHALLRGGSVDVALDESMASTPLERVLDRGAADVVVLKPMVLGGPDRTVAAARAARSGGVVPVVSTTVDAVVARTAAVHVAAALAPVAPSGLATANRLAADLGPDPAPVERGSLRVPREPGLGVELEGD